MKTLVKNQIDSKSFTFSLPATSANAKDFCDNYLVGTYAIFEKQSDGGSDVSVATFKQALVTCKNTDTNEVVYFGMSLPSSKTPNEVSAALIGKTINGVKIDKVFVKYDVVTSGEQMPSVQSTQGAHQEQKQDNQENDLSLEEQSGKKVR